jgi:hypothetical protein
MNKKKIYSRDNILHHFSQWESSGLSMAEYCRLHEIRPSTFYGWNKRYGKKMGSIPKVTSPSFVEVPILDKVTASGTSCRISHTTVDLTGDISTTLAQGLLAIFESRKSKGLKC